MMPSMAPNTKSKSGKICLALDLDETLVHSSFAVIYNRSFNFAYPHMSSRLNSQPVPDADYIIPVVIEDVVHNVFVRKRPGVDEFMRRVGEHFEVIDC